MGRLVFIALLLSVVPTAARAWEGVPVGTEDSVRVLRDGVTTSADTVPTNPPRTKSPGTAVLLSAILPGAGQFYNESYIKVPIVLGFGVYFVSSWLDYNRRYKEYRDRYTASLTQMQGGDQRLLTVREFYKDQRDTFAWYFLVLYLVNLADAYVDASLYGFDVGGNLSLRVLPLGAAGGSPGGCVRVTLKF
jgi:hypothetical protein